VKFSDGTTSRVVLGVPVVGACGDPLNCVRGQPCFKVSISIDARKIYQCAIRLNPLAKITSWVSNCCIVETWEGMGGTKLRADLSG